MKIENIIEELSSGKRPEDVIKFTHYMPFETKRAIALRVIGAFKDLYVDRSMFDYFLDTEIVRFYTDIEIARDPDEMLVDYDQLAQHNLIEAIRKTVGRDAEDFIAVAYKVLQAHEYEKSIDGSIAKLVSVMTEQFADLIGNVTEKVNSIDLKALFPNGIDAEQIKNIMSMLK